MKISAFRPYIFSGEAKDYHSPPYDTISKEMETELKKSPYNITHVTLPEKEDYSDAQSTLRSWMEKGILKKAQEDCMVILSQEFRYDDHDQRRYGLIALTQIFPADGSIKPHERTFEGPKKQRLNLMAALKCQPEPIFLLVSNQNFLSLIRKHVEDHSPDIEIEEPIGVVNRAYFVEDAQTIELLTNSVGQDNSIVADGHHRLAATIELAALSEGKSKKFWSRCLSYICSVSDSGLLIGGIHRCLEIPVDVNALMSRLNDLFTVEKVENPKSLVDITIYANGFYALRPNKAKILETMGWNEDQVYPALIARELILKKTLNLEESQIEAGVKYIHNSDEAIRGVNEGKFSMAILLPSWDKETFIRLIMKGELLTQKSTYFYPKPPSGLVLNCYEEEAA